MISGKTRQTKIGELKEDNEEVPKNEGSWEADCTGYTENGRGEIDKESMEKCSKWRKGRLK